MWAAITKPFAWLMRGLYGLTGNYGVSIILFGLAVNVILAPFMAQSKKSMMRTSRLQPRIQELQKRHAGNQQVLNEEMQKLYREEGINPMSGCIWTLIPFPILIALYSVIRQPLSRMMFVGKEVIEAVTNFLVTSGWYTLPAKADAYAEIKLVNVLHSHWTEVQSAISSGSFAGLDCSRLMDVDFRFLGLNLGEQPKWNFFTSTDWGDWHVWLPALGLFLIPFISAGLTYLSTKITQATNPQPAGDSAQAQATAQSMNLMMPLMSIWICFIMPAAMGIYWIANSVFGIIRDVLLTSVYKKKLDAEDAEKNARRAAVEKEREERRLETERLRAEGRTEVNTNTNKKKLQAQEKQKSDERKAALDRADRAARRERLGVQEAEKPASQVGNRRYARGRAYDPNRFSIPGAVADTSSVDAALPEEDVLPIVEEVENAVEEIAAEVPAPETVAEQEAGTEE